MRISDWSSDVCSSDLGSNTEPGCTQRSPAKRARKRSRRWVQRMVKASPRLTCFIGGGIRTYPTRLASLFSPSVVSADRKSVVSGKSVSVRVDLGGSRIIKKKKQRITQNKRVSI